jgi:HAD superfamily phosphoserine phosphatase-like hydrolase
MLGDLFCIFNPRTCFVRIVIMTEPKAVVFDIDGTLSPEISWLALTRDLGASVEQHAQIYKDYKEENTDYATSKKQLVSLWHATGNANKEFFAQLFESFPLDPAAERVVQAAKINRTVSLITGSMDMYAEMVARKLDIDLWYANTTLHWSKRGDLVDMDYDLNQTEKKLKQYREFCHKNGLELDDCLVIGDGENDKKLFEVCGRGVLIGDDQEDQTFVWKRITQLADFEQILLGR